MGGWWIWRQSGGNAVRKYRPGRKLTMQALSKRLLQHEYVYLGDKPMHPSFMISMQFHTLAMQCQMGRIRSALDMTPAQDRVTAAYDADPTLTSYDIAALLDLEDCYVRMVLRRMGRKLMRGRGEKKCQQLTHS
jgi:hypothetical protein